MPRSSSMFNRTSVAIANIPKGNASLLDLLTVFLAIVCAALVLAVPAIVLVFAVASVITRKGRSVPTIETESQNRSEKVIVNGEEFTVPINCSPIV